MYEFFFKIGMSGLEENSRGEGCPESLKNLGLRLSKIEEVLAEGERRRLGLF